MPAPSAMRAAWWEQRLEDLDRELGRLALVCRIRLLDTGIVERVLKGDRSVCAAEHRVAFDKLRGLLTLHFRIRQQAADELGQDGTTIVETYVVQRLRRSFPDMGRWPPV